MFSSIFTRSIVTVMSLVLLAACSVDIGRLGSPPDSGPPTASEVNSQTAQSTVDAHPVPLTTDSALEGIARETDTPPAIPPVLALPEVAFAALSQTALLGDEIGEPETPLLRHECEDGVCDVFVPVGVDVVGLKIDIDGAQTVEVYMGDSPIPVREVGDPDNETLSQNAVRDAETLYTRGDVGSPLRVICDGNELRVNFRQSDDFDLGRVISEVRIRDNALQLDVASDDAFADMRVYLVEGDEVLLLEPVAVEDGQYRFAIDSSKHKAGTELSVGMNFLKENGHLLAVGRDTPAIPYPQVEIRTGMSARLCPDSDCPGTPRFEHTGLVTLLAKAGPKGGAWYLVAEDAWINGTIAGIQPAFWDMLGEDMYVGPTPTFGPTATPRPTRTPKPTATRGPTRTPRPTATRGPTRTPRPTISPLIFELLHPGETVYHPPRERNPYSSYSYFPYSAIRKRNIVMTVWPHGGNTFSDDYAFHEQQAASTIEHVLKGYSEEYQTPIVVVAIPRVESLYVHSLHPRTFTTDQEMLRRPDLKLIEAVWAQYIPMMRQAGFKVDERVFMMGFSSPGMFSHRFAILHPERVKAIWICGEEPVPIPADRINGVPLTWPLGTYDFEELTGRQFDFDTYKTIPQFICRGENDLGDVRKYLDQYSLDQAHIVIDQFGDNSITQLRFLHEYLRSVGIHAKLKIYDDLAHELSATMIHDAFEFFEAHKAD